MFKILKKSQLLRYVGLAESTRRISYFHRFKNWLKDVGDSGCTSTFWL